MRIWHRSRPTSIACQGLSDYLRSTAAISPPITRRCEIWAAARRPGAQRCARNSRAFDRPLRARVSVDLDVDAPRLDHRLLRNHDFEHAIVVLRGDFVGPRVLGQRELALELALDALEALKSLAVLALLNAARAANRQYALVGGDLDVGRQHARKIGMHGKALRLFMNVHGRSPGAGRLAGAGRIGVSIAEQLIEPMQVSHQSPRFKSNDIHCSCSYFKSADMRHC